ncbi:MAG: cyclic nucleotide-binding domain-containing protein [Chitinophagaceae bacterium]|nr:cyclic nucleotide-binding domain-containing protein [Chitinophagaceae bacterium]
MTHYQQLKSFLRQIVNISDEDFNELGAVLQEKRFRKREIITGAGDIENYLYFVAKGLVRIFFLKGKREITYDIVKEGSITGSVSSFLTGKPSRYIVETMEPSVVLVLANKDLEELYTKDNKWEKFGRLITTNFILKQERYT